MTDGRGNDVIVHPMEQCGFEARKEFYFEEANRDALLMICERKAFEEALLTDFPTTTGYAPRTTELPHDRGGRTSTALWGGGAQRSRERKEVRVRKSNPPHSRHRAVGCHYPNPDTHVKLVR